MYDSFDNMYQATIGIDFLSKASKQLPTISFARLLRAIEAPLPPPLQLAPADSAALPALHRRCTWRTEPCDYSCGTLLARSGSGV